MMMSTDLTPRMRGLRLRRGGHDPQVQRVAEKNLQNRQQGLLVVAEQLQSFLTAPEWRTFVI